MDIETLLQQELAMVQPPIPQDLLTPSRKILFAAAVTTEQAFRKKQTQRLLKEYEKCKQRSPLIKEAHNAALFGTIYERGQQLLFSVGPAFSKSLFLRSTLLTLQLNQAEKSFVQSMGDVFEQYADSMENTYFCPMSLCFEKEEIPVKLEQLYQKQNYTLSKSVVSQEKKWQSPLGGIEIEITVQDPTIIGSTYHAYTYQQQVTLRTLHTKSQHFIESIVINDRNKSFTHNAHLLHQHPLLAGGAWYETFVQEFAFNTLQDIYRDVVIEAYAQNL